MYFREEPICGLPPQEIVSRGIARTFQDLRLFSEQTVRDNVLLAMHWPFGEGVTSSLFRPIATERQLRSAREKGDQFLAQVGLHDKAREGVQNLSYGE